MQFQGQQLQQYVSDLVRSLDEMKEKKTMLRSSIQSEEEEKQNIEKELQILSERLEKTNENDKKEIERTINDTENARNKIAESFKTLLNVLQKESHYLSKGTK